MKTCKRFTAPLLVAALVILPAAVTQLLSQQGNEAPAGFDTPTLSANPGSQSKGNGLVDDATFGATQAVFEEEDGVDKGLGPIYNARSCVECHQNPVTGGGSQIAEFRLGHRDRNGNFVSPSIAINRGQTVVPNRSLLNDRAICAEAQERAPGSENIRTFRMSLNVLGDGFVEAIDDNTLKNIAAAQPGQSGGRIKGEFILVPIAEAAGTTRVGRFGWKDQQASLLSFAGDAYVNEQGITSRLNPTDSTAVCKTTTDPEDVDNDIDQFATFMRTTKAPPIDAPLLATPDAQAGQQIFFKSVARSATLLPSRLSRPERCSMEAPSLFRMPSGTRPSIPSAISCFTTSGRAMESCRTVPRIPPTKCEPRLFGVCGLAIA